MKDKIETLGDLLDVLWEPGRTPKQVIMYALEVLYFIGLAVFVIAMILNQVMPSIFAILGSIGMFMIIPWYTQYMFSLFYGALKKSPARET